MLIFQGHMKVALLLETGSKCLAIIWRKHFVLDVKIGRGI